MATFPTPLPLSGQDSVSSPIDVASADTVHSVANGETHDVVVIGKSTTGGDFLVKIGGDTVGYTETVDAKRQRIIVNEVIYANGAAVNVVVDGPADGLVSGRHTVL